MNVNHRTSRKTRPVFIRRSVGLLCTLVLLTGYSVAFARTALVIGNSDYQSAPLDNPVNDATDIADKLGNLDFDVTILTNATRRSMRRAIRDYSEQLRRTGEVGLFYYAGHGMQIDGINYLIPVDAVMRSAFEIPDEAVAANSVLRALEEAGNDLNIVILDACRDNPFAKSYRSAADRGLARMDAPGGSIVAYATAPGEVALDGSGQNGVYTKHLLDNMNKPGMPIEQMFKKVRIGVIEESAGKQTPWEESSLRSDFYFSPAKVYEVNIPTQTDQAKVLESQPVAPAQSLVASVAPAEDVAVTEMLMKARLAMDANRLTTPERDSAEYYYRETLKLDPVNLDAHDGLQRITRRYIGLAQREMDANNLSGAQQFITRGLTIHPSNPRLQDMQQQTEELKIQQAKAKAAAQQQPPQMGQEQTSIDKDQNVASSDEMVEQSAPAENNSRIQRQKEAFKEDVSELKDSFKGLGKSLKGGFSGLFKKNKEKSN